MAFVAVVSGEPVGFASYDRLGPTDVGAEVVFVVADGYQRHGVATLLFESLAAYARTKGIAHFVAPVLAETTDMLEIFRATGLRVTHVNGGATVRVDVDLRPTPEYTRKFCDECEATAEAASIAAMLRPRSNAVVGANAARGTSATRSCDRSSPAMSRAPSTRSIHSLRAICGVPAFPKLSSVPEPIDLAIVAVPADVVPGVIEEAAPSGVRAVTVITAGFAQTGRSVPTSKPSCTRWPVDTECASSARTASARKH